MNRQLVVLSLVLAFAGLVLASPADGQQPARVYRLGWLAPNTVSGGPGEAFLGAMRDHGYIEGENLVIEVRDAMGQPDRFALLRLLPNSSLLSPIALS